MISSPFPTKFVGEKGTNFSKLIASITVFYFISNTLGLSASFYVHDHILFIIQNFHTKSGNKAELEVIRLTTGNPPT